MNSYDTAVKDFGVRKRREIRAVLLKWSGDDIGREIVRNINPLERFLPGGEMKQILTAIHKARSKTVDEIAVLYQKECFNSGNIRAGGPVTPAKPLVGRAVEKQAFVNYLYRNQRHHFRTKGMAEDFIARLLAGDPLSRAEALVLMSAFSAWVTWNDPFANTDPFSFARACNLAEMVRACLGLDPEHRMKGKPLLLITYRAGTSLQLCRPTIADAGLHRFFEPPPVGLDAHGLTKTWPPGMCKITISPLPRPEAVHAPHSFAHVDVMEQLL